MLILVHRSHISPFYLQVQTTSKIEIMFSKFFVEKKPSLFFLLVRMHTAPPN